MPLKDPFIVFGLLSVAVSACAADKALDRAVAERLAGNDAEALASVNAYLAVHEDDAAAKLENCGFWRSSIPTESAVTFRNSQGASAEKALRVPAWKPGPSQK